MQYAVKEIFLTLQAEGAHAGRVAVFCRFAGCNLWSGREHDRASAQCQFCDTDFVGIDGTKGARYESAAELVSSIEEASREARRKRAQRGRPTVRSCESEYCRPEPTKVTL